MTTESSFWVFSLQHYSNKQVRHACLKLQNDVNADVNLVLYCCWHACQYGEIQHELLINAIQFSQQWQKHVVAPLRQTRQWMKHQTFEHEELIQSSNQLREHVKEKELHAEKIQQTFLEAQSLEFISDHHEFALQNRPLQASINNIKQYFRYSEISIHAELEVVSRKNLATIINTIFKLADNNQISEQAFIDQ